MPFQNGGITRGKREIDFLWQFMSIFFDPSIGADIPAKLIYINFGILFLHILSQYFF